GAWIGRTRVREREGPRASVTGFTLSPGITPILAEFYVAELPLALALGYAFADRRGFEIAFGLNAFVLGSIKLATDFTDLQDLPVALGGISIGLSVLVATLRGDAIRRLPGLLWRMGGAVAIVVGAIKIARDF